MRNLNATDLLNVWEQGLNQPLLQRALILLVAACPEFKPGTLAEFSIGQRDERLLQLRERLFGPQLVNTVVCPECSERIEWENRISELRVPSLEGEFISKEFDFESENYQLRFRLPNSLDIAAVICSGETDNAEKNLLTRCILKAECAGEIYAVDQLPDSVIQAVSQRIEVLDPQAEIRINIHCPACSHRWDVLFDIASFLWTELNDWAERTLQMIHQLAQGYGWTEQEILALNPVRRQLYLGMLGS